MGDGETGGWGDGETGRRMPYFRCSQAVPVPWQAKRDRGLRGRTGDTAGLEWRWGYREGVAAKDDESGSES